MFSPIRAPMSQSINLHFLGELVARSSATVSVACKAPPPRTRTSPEIPTSPTRQITAASPFAAWRVSPVRRAMDSALLAMGRDHHNAWIYGNGASTGFKSSGAGGRGRTCTGLAQMKFKSVASSRSATPSPKSAGYQTTPRPSRSRRSDPCHNMLWKHAPCTATSVAGPGRPA
jgi:hypothetical protein